MVSQKTARAKAVKSS